MRQIVKIALALTIVYGFSSCTEESEEQTTIQEVEVIERTVFNESPMDPVYNQLRPEVQSFSISNNQTNTVVASGGTEIMVPANSFVDASGNPVKGEVNIEVVEAFDMKDFLTSNLQTTSGEQLLESAGMIHVDAKAGGKSLKLKEGSEISISMPMMQGGEGFQMFSGMHQPDGTINWEIDETAENEYLVPVPIELLYPNFNEFDGEIGYWWYGSHGGKYDPTKIESENSLVLTREFKSRWWKIWYATFLISSVENQDKFNTYWNWDEWELDYSILDLYFKAGDTPIEKLDSIACKMVMEYADREDFKQLVEEDNGKGYGVTWWFGYDWTVEDNLNWVTSLNQDQARGVVPNFPETQVNLTDEGAYDQLIAEGKSSKMALDMVSFAKEEKKVLAQLQREIDAREAQQEVKSIINETVFTTGKLGWINCDRFLNDPEAGKAEMIVSIEGVDKVDFVDCSLIIPDLNVRLSAYPHGEDQYTFTKPDGMYTNLPLGKKALIVGISLQDGKTYFSSSEIEIKDGLDVNLNMELVEKDQLMSKLDKALVNS